MRLDGAPRPFTSTDRGEVYPRWTRDGRSLFFHNWERPRRIWRVSHDGGPPAPVTSPDLDAAFADISPDGRTLAFSVTEQADERVYLMPIDGTGRPLPRADRGSVPRWSPDGSWIAFAGDRGYNGGIFLARPDGSDLKRLTDTGGWPVWWPGGRRIGYITIRGDLSQQIETVAIDAPSTVDVLPIRFRGSNHPFDVSNDGRWLATTTSVHVSSEIWVLDPSS
jgi:Tol biopolymer transport system component